MARIDRQTIEELSQITGFQMDILEKAYRLTELLSQISSIPDLSSKLILKGGTALNFINLDMPRLSVDADLDYVSSPKKVVMERERKNIDVILASMFRTLGYEARSDSSYALGHHDLWYRNTAGNRDRIMLEINFVKRVTCLPSVLSFFRQPFGFEPFRIRALKSEELLGTKLKALVQRATARDLFDAYVFLKSGISFDLNEARKCFIFSLCLDEDPRGMNLNNVNELSEHDLKTGLLPFLSRVEKPDLERMKARVIPLIREFLNFTASELGFISRLFEEQEYRPDLLFKGVRYNKEIGQHPGIAWRLAQLKGTH